MKALFDFNFNSFVTPKLVKIVYILITIGLGIMYLGFVIAAFATEQLAAGFFVMIIVGPLVVLIYLALARMGLESLIATIRTAENTGELVRLSGGNAPGAAPQAGGAYPGGPAAPPANPYGNGPQA
ncbi:DUF4282 domain-containing protein [Paeniglutamicibacter sp. ABSL32-1]|uniref:DUF4282 domain-containing protein n=1 Tax=Paeniglutamicibacter quisquiliarum TaxID=2849498 RepID=UPI001C2DD7E1|nr:DUF4282 domain-containing protein [Paeniglutamicibacter quisquiliarum]